MRRLSKNEKITVNKLTGGLIFCNLWLINQKPL